MKLSIYKKELGFSIMEIWLIKDLINYWRARKRVAEFRLCIIAETFRFLLLVEYGSCVKIKNVTD